MIYNLNFQLIKNGLNIFGDFSLYKSSHKMITTFFQNYQISSQSIVKRGWAVAAISERTFVIYCHWLESTFPETGGKIIFGVKYLFALGFFSFRFVSLTLSWAGPEVTLELKLPKKWFPALMSGPMFSTISWWLCPTLSSISIQIWLLKKPGKCCKTYSK